ncbi:MAG: hypothetical protein M1839_004166 [Geoglossum umbratile]|nr:MAG: hypothetical protein M1839_004166 [Geoglossum umbratile]
MSVEASYLIRPDLSDKGPGILAIAIHDNDVSMVRPLLQQGVDLKRRFPLHRAAKLGHTERLRLRPIHYASCLGHVEVVKLLLKHGDGVALAADGYIPLHSALFAPDPDPVVSILLEAGVDPSAITGSQIPVIRSGTCEGHETVVSTQSDDGNEYTPLHEAARAGKIGVLRALLQDKRTNPSLRAKRGGTALHVAAGAGGDHLGPVTQLLLSYGADPLIFGDAGWSVIHLAARFGRLAMVKLLEGVPGAVSQRGLNGSITVFWIDQICVNQADLLERTAQVAVMSRVYSQAKAVFFWMGEMDEDIKQLANFSFYVGRDIETFETSLLQPPVLHTGTFFNSKIPYKS